jgi:hypothetical protein
MDARAVEQGLIVCGDRCDNELRYFQFDIFRVGLDLALPGF